MAYKYYRSQLSSVQKTAYDLLETAIRTMEPTVNLPMMTSSQLGNTLDAITLDFPEFFYLDIYGVKNSNKGKNGCYYQYPGHIELPLQYEFSKNTLNLIMKKIEMVSDKLIARARKAGCRSDLALVAYLHNYLTDNVSYTQKARNPKRNHCIIGPLINRECVCEGYAKTFLYLMNRAGIPALYVSGKTDPNSSSGHGWNMVKINGYWYHTDVTWNSNGRGKNGDWDFFLLTSAEISAKSHILPNNVKLPMSDRPLTLNRSERRIS